jgi:uncharacterized protein YpuA (DUF1002 family)
MKRRMNWYGVCLLTMIMMMTLVPLASGQENNVNVNGMDVDVSSGDNSVKINKNKVTVHTGDGTMVKTHGQEVVTKSSSKVSAKVGTQTFSEDATISGRNINTNGNGLVLKGNGAYTLIDCNINAGQNALIVTGNATVTIKNCVFNGKNSAILIKGNGTVKASKSVFNGKIKKLDNADFIDNGGNVNNG